MAATVEPRRRGCFITFEGGEGAGKSTQIAQAASWLRADGTAKTHGMVTSREVVTTREPGGSPRAERIRAAVLSGVAKPHGPFAEALMFAAARLDHLATLIRPSLARGAIVLCDRFSDSTRAYQGAAGGLEPETLSALERVVVGTTRPDLTLILDLSPEIGLSRARQRGRAMASAPDRFEAEALGFHERLRAAFLAIAAAEPARCAVIDAQGSPDRVAQAIRAAIAARLPHLVRDRSDAA